MSLDRVDELLDAIEGVPEDERERHLERICPDPELRRQALTLLAVEEDAWSYLDHFSDELLEGGEAADLVGQRIGAYRLLRPLGRGGMGVVYEAERADGEFEQRVALKLLTTALAGTGARRWFLAERQILAGLDHPSIAHIVDGGVTEDGTPWFAMEYVEGEPIDAYCDRRRLGIRERIELFRQVCDAVEHAHRRLVVHRDLKPSNVLVTAEQRVKLLDFGIARLLDADETARIAPPTRTFSRAMTPEYASPEQVRGEAVTTASDVYQLGLVLYELLTGHRPYVLGRRSASEIERVVCKQPPTRLSTVLFREDTLKPSTGHDRPPAPADAEVGRFSPVGATLSGLERPASPPADRPTAEKAIEEVCRSRRSSPVRLRRRLRGDLDNIVAKALSKEPGRRYGSADRLARDLRRHLDGMPVTARADTWVYRGRKFLERHSLGATATAVALVLVLLLVAGMTAFHTVRIRGERDRAQTEAAKAQQVSELLAGLFRSADPSEARDGELTARALLDRGVERVDGELAAQPVIQADMLHVLGRTYLSLGTYDDAERLLSRALELRRRELGPNHPDIAAILSDVGSLRSRQGQYVLARQTLHDAIRMLEASRGRDDPGLADMLQRLGGVYRDLNEHDKGRDALQRALALQIRVSGEHSEPVAGVLDSLASLLTEIGDLERAERLYERALAIHERELGADHPQVGNELMNLANVRATQGRLEGIETLYRRSIAIQRKAYGPNHTRVALALSNLGDFLTVSERTGEAIDTLQEALEVYDAAVGPEHPYIAFPLATLGDAQLAAGRLREARRSYRRCVAIREKAFGEGTFDSPLAYALVRLGGIEALIGNEAAAEESRNRAVGIWRQAPAEVDPQLAPTLLELGRWLVEQRRCPDAAPLLQRALRLERARQSPSSAQVAELNDLLANCRPPAGHQPIGARVADGDSS